MEEADVIQFMDHNSETQETTEKSKYVDRFFDEPFT